MSESGTNTEANAFAAAIEDVTQNYLETLDALSTVYDSAAGFAQLFDSSSIAHFTLQRILEALEIERGVIFLEVGGVLRYQFDAKNALTLLNEEAVEDGIDDASFEGRSVFFNGEEAVPFLRSGVANHNLILAPIVAGHRRLGIVVGFAEAERLITTKDLKLVGAVTSQAAIALSGAQHHEEILVERQKLRSIIDHSAGGIVVLAPDGKATLTNRVARELLNFEADCAEGYSFVEETSMWKFSQEPESLFGEGAAEVSLQMKIDLDGEERSIWVVARRVRAPGGALANIVLNLHDPSWGRRCQ